MSDIFLYNQSIELSEEYVSESHNYSSRNGAIKKAMEEYVKNVKLTPEQVQLLTA